MMRMGEIKWGYPIFSDRTISRRWGGKIWDFLPIEDIKTAQPFLLSSTEKAFFKG